MLLPGQGDAYKRLHFWAGKKAKVIGYKGRQGGVDCLIVEKIEKAD